MFGTLKRVPKNKYYLKHIKRMRAYSKEYYKKNKSAQQKRVKDWNKKNPWFATYRNILSRCNYPRDKKYKYYGAKGIKCLLTLEQVKFLWIRDKASNLIQASIDRKNNKLHYTLRNCRFIEMALNRKKG